MSLLPARHLLCLLGALWLLGFSAAADEPAKRRFQLEHDTFAFSNDTAFAYGVDEQGELHISLRKKAAEFAHRCFVLTRGVLQFYQFATFAPKEPRLTREEYRRRLLKLFRIAVWSGGPREKIKFPGYADLRSFSKAYEGLLKETLGNWVPSYLRVGNWRMTMPHFRAGQTAAHRWLKSSLDAGRPRALYLARFPHMNHVVIPYAYRQLPDGRTRYEVYDPNYPAQPTHLDYVPSERSFDFEKRWYFPGGRVNVMRVFLSPIH